MSAIDKEKFPTAALWGAAVVIVVAIVGTAWGRYVISQQPVQSFEEQEQVAASVDLIFSDQADGSVLVKNAANNAQVMVIAAGDGAFLRAVIRGYARDRRARSISEDTPFRLYRLVDSRFVFEDTGTNRRVNLRAFGTTQQADFARLLPPNSPK